MIRIALPFPLRIAMLMGYEPRWEIRIHEPGKTRSTEGRLVTTRDYSNYTDAKEVMQRMALRPGCTATLRLVDNVGTMTAPPLPKSFDTAAGAAAPYPEQE